MNRNNLLLIAALVIAGIVITIQSAKVNNLRDDLGITKRDLKKKDKQLELKHDSIVRLEQKLMEEDAHWTLIVQDQLNALIAERGKTAAATKKYEKLKNTPVPSWTSSELDSLLAVVISRHK